MIKKVLMLASMILAATLTLGLIGCGDAGGEAETKAPVILYINQMNEGDQYQASVLTGGTAYQEDEIIIDLGNYAINPNIDLTSFYMDVICKGYEVSYFRKDTGTRVPATFTGSLNTIVPVNNTVSTSIIICRASQKQMPPLEDLCLYGYDQETGLTEIHTTCRVVVWGETFAGEEVVTDPGHLTVNFACTWTSI
ncbi:MAG TPA: hypothetical protein PLV45_15865 [bacterium]|nr:hypothetical protein [bacterium]